jgi:DNA transformation protein
MTRDITSAQELTDLPNIGRTVAEKLKAAGVGTPEQLRRLGSIEAALRIKVESPDDAPCRSMLSGLEGAIRGVRWHTIDEAQREKLWRCYQVRLRERDAKA